MSRSEPSRGAESSNGRSSTPSAGSTEQSRTRESTSDAPAEPSPGRPPGIAHRIVRSLAALGSLIVFVAALWLLHHTLQTVSIHAVFERISALSWGSVALAVGLTAVSYVVLTGYDLVALRYVRRSLPYPTVAMASFIGFSVGYNLGLAFLTGGSVRYRIYSAAGLSAAEIASVIAICTFTFALGTVVVTASALTVDPTHVLPALQLPTEPTRLASIAVLVLFVAYLLWIARHPGLVRVREWSFRLPSPGLTLGQIGLVALDLGLAAAVLYVLIPAPGISYLAFLGAYVAAMVAGIASHVPAGLGVFETVLLLALPDIPRDTLIGAVLMYRLVYYLLPLGVAALLMGAHEFLTHQHRFLHFTLSAGQWVSRLAPQVVGLTVFVGAAVLLFSGATPVGSHRLQLLEGFEPLAVLESAYVLASAAGFGLLILARGLFRRLDRAYRLAVLVLAAGIVTALLRGLDYEEAILLLVILCALLLARSAFQRRASLLAQRFHPGWTVSVALVIVGTIWLGLFSYRDVAYSNALWWHFAFADDASRFLRSSLAVVGLALTFIGLKSWHPTAPRRQLAGPNGLARAAQIAAASPRTDTAFTLLDGRRLLFSDSGAAFLVYQVQGRLWVAIGDPVGPADEHAELLWRFRELCEYYDGVPVFYLVGEENRTLYLDLGLSLLKVGEQARVALPRFDCSGSRAAEACTGWRRVRASGASFAVVEPQALAPLLAECRSVAEAWLQHRGAEPKLARPSSGGLVLEDYLGRFPCATVRRGGRLLAFANVVHGVGAEELGTEIVRYAPSSASRTDQAARAHATELLDFLLVELLIWGRERGFRWFNLGSAPAPEVRDDPLAPVWRQTDPSAFRHGEHLHDVVALRAWKQRFAPCWEPRYLASLGGLELGEVLRDVLALIVDRR